MIFNNILTVDCLKDFSCIGSECEFSCCVDWRIGIDDKTFKKYKNCKDAAWQNRFIENMEAVESNLNNHIIKLDENKKCPFLDENMLCSVQKRFGHNYLSKVCRVYPRFYNKINNQKIEKNYYLSCPVVIKKMLLLNDKLVFTNISENVIIDEIHFNNQLQVNNEYHKYFYNLRRFTLDIMQNSNYSLKDRLLILTYFFSNFNASNEQETIDVDQLIILFRQIMDTGAINEVLQEVKTNRNNYYEILQIIITSAFSGSGNDVFRKYCKDIFRTVQLDKREKTNYFYLYDGYYSVFTKKHPFVLENYLCYSIFTTLFPFTNDNMWESLVHLIIRWTIINFCFMGLMNEGTTEIEEKDFLKCFAAFSRALDASKPSPINYIYDFLKEREKTGLADMFNLIKV